MPGEKASEGNPFRSGIYQHSPVGPAVCRSRRQCGAIRSSEGLVLAYVALPLHRSHRVDALGVATDTGIENLPAEFGRATSVIEAVNPVTELILAPDLGIISRDDFGKFPNALNQLALVATMDEGVGRPGRTLFNRFGRFCRMRCNTAVSG